MIDLVGLGIPLQLRNLSPPLRFKICPIQGGPKK